MTSTSNNTVKPALLIVASANPYALGKGKNAKTTPFAIFNEGVTTPVLADDLYARLSKDLVRVDVQFRSPYSNAEDVQLAMVDVRPYRKAQDEVLNDDGSVKYKAQPEVKGSTLGLMASYKDGSQLFISIDQLASVLYMDACFVSNFVPVLAEQLPTIGDVPNADDFASMVQRAGFESADAYAMAVGKLGLNDTALFYNIGVNWPTTMNASTEKRWCKEGEKFLYGKRFDEMAQALVDWHAAEGTVMDIDQAKEALQAEGWELKTVTVPGVEVRKYSSAFLRYNACLIASVATGRRAENGNPATVAVAAIPLYLISEVIFGQRAIAPKPESRRAQRGSASAKMAASIAVARQR